MRSVMGPAASSIISSSGSSCSSSDALYNAKSWRSALSRGLENGSFAYSSRSQRNFPSSSELRSGSPSSNSIDGKAVESLSFFVEARTRQRRSPSLCRHRDGNDGSWSLVDGHFRNHFRKVSHVSPTSGKGGRPLKRRFLRCDEEKKEERKGHW